MRSACHHHHVESAENLDSLCLISLCSELLSLFLLGRASESRGRQTGSLTRAAMLSPLLHRPVFVCSPLLWLDRFPVACGISETRNNERCKSGQKKCEIPRRSQRMWRFAKSRASLISLLMESYGDVKETYIRGTAGTLTWTFAPYCHFKQTVPHRRFSIRCLKPLRFKY